MTTNEIQQLLEGGLSDVRATELLHILSVSPEKREIFLQHIKLNSVLESDRFASVLTSNEADSIWSNISNSITPNIPLSANKFLFNKFITKWALRSSALICAGVIGYILGSNLLFNSNSTNKFSNKGIQSLAVLNEGSINNLDFKTQLSKSSSSLNKTDDKLLIEPSTKSNTNLISLNKSSNPKVIYRDKIIEKKVPSSVKSENDNFSKDNGFKNRLTALQFSNDSLNLALIKSKVSTSKPNEEVKLSENLKIENSDLGKTQFKKDENLSNPLIENNVKNPFTNNGIEFSFNERIGFITPEPIGIFNPDLEFSNRSLGISYRFLDGRVGVGGRAAYGTISTISLSTRNQTETGYPILDPKMIAEKKVWFEIFGNYRLPISKILAAEIEGSYGGTSTSKKSGADLVILLMLSNNIGLQFGGGLSQYSYDLTAERESFKKVNKNIGTSSQALDKFQGTMIEGRYGLYVRF